MNTRKRVDVQAAMTTKQQSILPFPMEAMPSSDASTSHAGLPLIAETMRALGLEQVARDHFHLQQRNAGPSDYQKIESVVLLMAAGGDCYDDMAVLRADAGLQRLLGYPATRACTSQAQGLDARLTGTIPNDQVNSTPASCAPLRPNLLSGTISYQRSTPQRFFSCLTGGCSGRPSAPSLRLHSRCLRIQVTDRMRVGSLRRLC